SCWRFCETRCCSNRARAARPKTWCCGIGPCKYWVFCGLRCLPSPCMRSELTGWGGTAPTAADVVEPSSEADVGRLVSEAPPRRVVARGLARSYGDAAQNAGGRVVQATALARLHAVDVDAATIDVEAGASLDWLMRVLVPVGLFPAVT